MNSFGGRQYVGRPDYPRGKKKIGTTVNFSEGDIALVEVIMEKLAVGKSEAIRTAVRAYAAILSQK